MKFRLLMGGVHTAWLPLNTPPASLALALEGLPSVYPATVGVELVVPEGEDNDTYSIPVDGTVAMFHVTFESARGNATWRSYINVYCIHVSYMHVYYILVFCIHV